MRSFLQGQWSEACFWKKAVPKTILENPMLQLFISTNFEHFMSKKVTAILFYIVFSDKIVICMRYDRSNWRAWLPTKFFLHPWCSIIKSFECKTQIDKKVGDAYGKKPLLDLWCMLCFFSCRVSQLWNFQPKINFRSNSSDPWVWFLPERHEWNRIESPKVCCFDWKGGFQSVLFNLSQPSYDLQNI